MAKVSAPANSVPLYSQGGLADDEEAAGQGAAALGVDVDQCQRKLSWQRRQDEAESATQSNP